MNMKTISALLLTALRADVTNSPIPQGTGSHYPLASSGVALGKSYGLELAKQPLALEESFLLEIASFIFSNVSAKDVPLDNDVLSITIGGQHLSFDMTEYRTKVVKALHEAKVVSIKARLSCTILSFEEFEDSIRVIGYSPVPLKEEYEILRQPITDLNALLAVIDAEKMEAFKSGKYDLLPALDAKSKSLSSEHAFELILPL